MRTNLDHLPEEKRRELERIVEILFAEFEDTTALGTQEWKRQGRILKIILFGSFARGDWVADPKGGYFSDYDILVVVSDRRLTDKQQIWSNADDHLIRAVTIEKSISAPVNFIIHDLAEVNDELRHGRPFFVDIVRDGIALYEMEGCDFEQPRHLSRAKRQAEAQRHFDSWFNSAVKFKRAAQFLASDDAPIEAAYNYHQSAERFYRCVLLVLTLYAPKSHRLNFLRSQAEGHDARLIEVWPRNTRFGQRCFELLRRAYVEGRPSTQYSITAEELEWIAERMEVLQSLVRQICEERLALG
jgi:predicted nucleotidyltransferase